MRRWKDMNDFITLIGVGFVVLCFCLLLGIAALFKYIIKIKDKKFEIAPSKTQSQNNTDKSI